MLIPCARSAQRGDVGERVAVLVDVDRDRRAPLQLARRRGRRRGSGCSQYSTPSCGELRERLERLVERPVLVDVDLQRQRPSTARTARTRSTSSPSRAAELQLQPLEAAADPLRRARHLVRVAEPDRPRRRRAAPAAARAAARRARPASLPAEVVQRAVERRLAPRSRPLRQPPPISSSANGSSPSSSACRLDEGERRLGRLVVALDRARPRRTRSSPSCRISTDDDLGLVASTRARS